MSPKVLWLLPVLVAAGSYAWGERPRAVAASVPVFDTVVYVRCPVVLEGPQQIKVQNASADTVIYPHANLDISGSNDDRVLIVTRGLSRELTVFKSPRRYCTLSRAP